MKYIYIFIWIYSIKCLLDLIPMVVVGKDFYVKKLFFQESKKNRLDSNFFQSSHHMFAYISKAESFLVNKLSFACLKHMI